MNMIDVMKRLAELDANNLTIVKENTNVEECGMMPMPGMGGMDRPTTPATLNVTAGSGEELGNMLAQIMALAGVHKVEPEHLGIEQEPMSLTSEPAVGAMPAPGAGDTDDMRSMISAVDKLNPDTDGEEGDEEETDEEETDEEADPFGIPGGSSSPNNPIKQKPFNANQFSNQENQPGGGETSNGEKRQNNLPTATFENLMKEYQAYIGE